MKTLYLDIFSGISGDMFVGALLDLGVDAHQFEHELEKLHLDGYHLHISRQQKSEIAGTKFDVHLEDDHYHEHGHGTHSHQDHGHSHGHEHHHCDECTFAEIKRLISESKLSDWTKGKSIAV